MTKKYFDHETDNFLKNIRYIIDYHKKYANDDNNTDDMVCITCGHILSDMEHNYGTDEYPQCIICGNEKAI